MVHTYRVQFLHFACPSVINSTPSPEVSKCLSIIVTDTSNQDTVIQAEIAPNFLRAPHLAGLCPTGHTFCSTTSLTPNFSPISLFYFYLLPVSRRSPVGALRRKRKWTKRPPFTLLSFYAVDCPMQITPATANQQPDLPCNLSILIYRHGQSFLLRAMARHLSRYKPLVACPLGNWKKKTPLSKIPT